MKISVFSIIFYTAIALLPLDSYATPQLDPFDSGNEVKTKSGSIFDAGVNTPTDNQAPYFKNVPESSNREKSKIIPEQSNKEKSKIIPEQSNKEKSRPVPEPSTMLLLGSGLAGLALMMRRIKPDSKK